MKLPLSWLKEQTPLTASPQDIADTLVRLGHEVEAVELPRELVKGVRVGLIESKVPHPDADKLSLLKVNIGEADSLSIVCGASNMNEGDKVPVATVGTSLPNGMKIKKGKIRGETSFGMCCSEAELGLADDAQGLLILPQDAPIGAEVGEYLQMEEAVFDLSITPNRGDCMSVRGLARDLAADAGVELAEVELGSVAVDNALEVPKVTVSAVEDCPLYTACMIRGVKVTDSPAWLQRRLIAAGQRPVNGIVDVLNYIMLDLGQPMHAFDMQSLQGSVHVRSADQGEAFKALDGRELVLNEGDLVVCDDQSVIALAGIMGSEHSGVTEATSDILLESAFFRPARVSTTRRIYAMVSEASMRFERGVDPLMVDMAMQRAITMIIELFGGSCSAMSVSGDVREIAGERTLACNLARLESRLGITIPVSCDAVLERMGFVMKRVDGRLEVDVPSYRHDITIPEDLSEEYARVIGFDAIPADMPALTVGKPTAPDTVISDAVAAGFVQVISYAFISPKEQQLFVAEGKGDIELQNPISDAMTVMRRSIWPSLLNIAKYNLNRQQPGVALVEQGRTYTRQAQVFREANVLAWLMTGEIECDEWFGNARQADFFDLKGAVEFWLQARGLTARFVADDHIQGLQAGQSAQILVGRGMVGRIGRVDAGIAQCFDIEMPVYVADIDLDALPGGKKSRFAPLPEFPGFERDLVFLFDKGTQAEAVLQVVRKAGGKLLTDARIFDLYQGQGVPEGKVSMGVRFTLQATDRTLTQEDSDNAMKAITEAVETRFSAVLRG